MLNYLLMRGSILFDAIRSALLGYFASIALHEVARRVRHRCQHVSAGLRLDLGSTLRLFVLQQNQQSRGQSVREIRFKYLSPTVVALQPLALSRCSCKSLFET